MKTIDIKYSNNNYPVVIDDSFKNIFNHSDSIDNVLVISEDSLSDYIKIDDKDNINIYKYSFNNVFNCSAKDFQDFIIRNNINFENITLIIAGDKEFIDSCVNNNEMFINSNIIIVPATLRAIDSYSISEIKIDLVYINTKLFDYLSDGEFFNGFSYVMKAAIIKDASFYTYLIDKMYEICEKEKETISYIIDKFVSIKYLVLNTAKNGKCADTFANTIANAIYEYKEHSLKIGECQSLAMVASAFISWKKNWLNKDEYYEIRDMFVPFYLPISMEMIDIDRLTDLICNNLESNGESCELILLKKIGKTVIDTSITREDIRNAIDELNFDEAW